MKQGFFLTSEYGAAAVEYAVALIAVIIIGGAGSISIGGGSTQMVANASVVVSAAETASQSANN